MHLIHLINRTTWLSDTVHCRAVPAAGERVGLHSASPGKDPRSKSGRRLLLHHRGQEAHCRPCCGGHLYSVTSSLANALSSGQQMRRRPVSGGTIQGSRCSRDPLLLCSLPPSMLGPCWADSSRIQGPRPPSMNWGGGRGLPARLFSGHHWPCSSSLFFLFPLLSLLPPPPPRTFCLETAGFAFRGWLLLLEQDPPWCLPAFSVTLPPGSWCGMREKLVQAALLSTWRPLCCPMSVTCPVLPGGQHSGCGLCTFDWAVQRCVGVGSAECAWRESRPCPGGGRLWTGAVQPAGRSAGSRVRGPPPSSAGPAWKFSPSEGKELLSGCELFWHFTVLCVRSGWWENLNLICP